VDYKQPFDWNSLPDSNLVERLKCWRDTRPDKVAYYFTDDGETTSQITYLELDQRARAIAAKLLSLGLGGKRALLLYPPGLDFVTGFFGCLYAGVVSIPAFPPRRNRNILRIQSISDDAQAAAVFDDRRCVGACSGRAR